MSFYQSIADYYDQIFPFNLTQLKFIKSSFKNTAKLSVLDIGCGTGNLSNELARHFNEVTAIDLDEAMLEKAIEKDAHRIKFLSKDMLTIEEEFGISAFDAIICFGNTLVHLDGQDKIFDFFKQAINVLKSDGKLLMQTINYDRIIELGIDHLPTIENDKIKFIRNYDYQPIQNIIDFDTSLLIKETGEIIENKIQLYPIRNFELVNLLYKAGFKAVFFFKNFNRDIINEDSIPLVIEARL